MDEYAVRDWVDRYVRAWESNDPDEIAALFTEDARYYTAPAPGPVDRPGRDRPRMAGTQGRAGRLDVRVRRPGHDRRLGFVQGRTGYKSEGIDYSNLWVLRLAGDGRCSEFTEWWMEASD